MDTSKILEFKNFLHLKDTPGEDETRLIKKTQHYTWLFRLCPGIQMLAIGNSVAMNGAHSESDIDLFIITQKKRMWYVRIFLTFMLSILGQRKTAKYHAGKFCLSFFMTDEHLSLQNIALENDIYLYYRILTLKPIINNDTTYERFIQANSEWCDFSKMQDILKENTKYISSSSRTWGTDWKFLDLKNWGYKKIFLPKTLKSYERL